MEELIKAIIGEYLTQRSKIVDELLVANPNDSAYLTKKSDLQAEIDKIDFKMNDLLIRLEVFYVNENQKNQTYPDNERK